jgi:hypothetical protein
MPNDAGASLAPDYGWRTREYLGRFLDRRRESKRQRFIEKINGGCAGPVIVAEGDSWFEYPNAEDLLVRLGERYAVLSLAKAGDSFAEVTGAGDELFPTLNNPPAGKDFHIVLLSLGGNEVMGRIEDFVHPYQYGRPDAEYIKPEFAAMLAGVEKKFGALLQRVIDNGTQHVILHGYDYPHPIYPPEPGEGPNGSQWIGPPLKNLRNIGTITTYRYIANTMLRDFNAMLARVASDAQYQGRVHVIRLLGTIGERDTNKGANQDLWFDEIHGTEEGFARLARKFEPIIDQVWAAMQQA